MLIAAVATGLVSCVGGREARAYTVSTGGVAARGVTLIGMKKCGSCHMIPGIDGANGLVGPPLGKIALRTYIGGQLPNRPDNLVHWLMSPPSIKPHTAMPILGLNQQEARDVAAYLYTLN